MRKLIVFQGDREGVHSNAHIFVQHLNDAIGEPVAENIPYSDLVFTFAEGACRVTRGSSDEPIESLADMFYIRDYNHYQAERYALAAYLASKRKKVFNSDVLANEALSKLEQLVAFTNAGIPVPRSRFTSSAPLVRPVFGYPCSVKSITGSNNRLNYRVASEEELTESVEDIGSKILMQEFIENDGDYKIIIMLGEIVGVYKRTKMNTYESRKVARIVTEDTDVMELAARTAVVLGREFCGVDIVRDQKSGKLYVLECNFNSGLYIAGLGVDEALFDKVAMILKREK